MDIFQEIYKQFYLDIKAYSSDILLAFWADRARTKDPETGKYNEGFRIIGPKNNSNKSIENSDIIKVSGPKTHLESLLKIGKAETVDSKMEKVKLDRRLIDEVYDHFSLGAKYTKKDIKETLALIFHIFYKHLSAKSVDINIYFEAKEVKIVNPLTGKNQGGYKLISRKFQYLQKI